MTENREAGLTIVEVIITIAVFVLVLPVFAGMITSLGYINNKNNDYAVVNGLAEAKIESLRSLGYDNLSVGSVDFSSELPGTLSSPKSGTYTVSNEGANIKKIIITISYTVQNQPQSFDFTTLIGSEGLAQ